MRLNAITGRHLAEASIMFKRKLYLYCKPKNITGVFAKVLVLLDHCWGLISTTVIRVNWDPGEQWFLRDFQGSVVLYTCR